MYIWWWPRGMFDFILLCAVAGKWCVFDDDPMDCFIIHSEYVPFVVNDVYLILTPWNVLFYALNIVLGFFWAAHSTASLADLCICPHGIWNLQSLQVSCDSLLDWQVFPYYVLKYMSCPELSCTSLGMHSLTPSTVVWHKLRSKQTVKTTLLHIVWIKLYEPKFYSINLLVVLFSFFLREYTSKW